LAELLRLVAECSAPTPRLAVRRAIPASRVASLISPSAHRLGHVRECRLRWSSDHCSRQRPQLMVATQAGSSPAPCLTGATIGLIFASTLNGTLRQGDIATLSAGCASGRGLASPGRLRAELSLPQTRCSIGEPRHQRRDRRGSPSNGGASPVGDFGRRLRRPSAPRGSERRAFASSKQASCRTWSQIVIESLRLQVHREVRRTGGRLRLALRTHRTKTSGC
jgi:hypothetical protein